MDFNLPVVLADFDVPPIGCEPYTYTFNNTSLYQSNTSIFWDFGERERLGDAEKPRGWEQAAHAARPATMLRKTFSFCEA